MVQERDGISTDRKSIEYGKVEKQMCRLVRCWLLKGILQHIALKLNVTFQFSSWITTLKILLNAHHVSLAVVLLKANNRNKCRPYTDFPKIKRLTSLNLHRSKQK